MTNQEKEIASIKERSIALKLSDNDCERISEKAGLHGLTVAELLENFIGDLVGGTYTNGSDECERANSWFERCWFGMFPEETLLWHLLETDIDIDDFLTTYDELKYFESNPEEFAEEIESDELWFKDDYESYIGDYLETHTDIDIEKEIETCRQWLKDLENLKGGIDNEDRI